MGSTSIKRKSSGNDSREGKRSKTPSGKSSFSKKEKIKKPSEEEDVPMSDEGFKPLSDEEDEDGSAPANGGVAKSSAAESHAKQKALARERKAARPNADAIQRCKRIWERLRRTSEVTTEERTKLVSELLELVSGRTHDFVFKHDAGRVIQCALKFAPKEQKVKIAQELKGNFRALAESKYAKFLIAKLIVYGGDEIREMIVSEFYGHVRKLINHPEAAWILDDIYRGVATPKQRAQLLREWYGAEFALFKDDAELPISDLKTILEASPEKRKPIMNALFNLINQLIQKKKSAFTLLHDAMLQYFLNVEADSAESKAFIELLYDDEEGDLLKNLAFTSSGSRVVCLAFARGSASNRKHLIKGFKGLMGELALDQQGHMVLVSIFETVDDTKLSSKAVYSELFGKTHDDPEFQNAVPDLLVSDAGRVSLLYPISAHQRWFLHPTHEPLIAEIRENSKFTSKKDTNVRWSELVRVLLPFLLNSVSKLASELVESSSGCQCIAETLLAGNADKAEAAGAVAKLAGGDPSVEGHISRSTAATRMMKALVWGGRYDASKGSVAGASSDDSLKFAERLWPEIKAHLNAWVTGPGSFVILAMVECEKWDGQDELKEALKKAKKQYQKAIDSTATELEAEPEKPKGKKLKGKSKPRQSLPGTRLILQAL